MTSSSFIPGRTRALRSCAMGTLACALLTAVGLGWPSAAKAASPDGSGLAVFDLAAQAVAVQSTLTDPGIPFGLPFSVGSYGASSTLDTSGVSAADAGAPYSPLVSTLPSTGNGTVQSSAGFGLPVVPAFPGYVSARDPIAPSAQQNAGGYDLLASALPSQALGEVSVGAQSAFSPENNAFAHAKSSRTESGVLSEGTAGVHALTLAGILDLANVSSSARLSKDIGGRTSAVTTTELGSVSFAGITSGVTGAGIGALGAAPTPVSTGSLGAINDVLKPAGLSLAYLPAEYGYTDGSTSSGSAPVAAKEVAALTSAALRVFFTSTSERGTTTQTVDLGRVSVALTALNVDGATAAPELGSGGGTVTADVAAAAPRVITSLATDSGPGPGVPADGASPQMFRPAAASAPVIAAGDVTSFEDAYLLLAAAAALAFLVAQAVRVVAVRSR